MTRYRVGSGLDAHRLVDGRPLVLGGVRVPFERGLEGHSDGDCVLHAAVRGEVTLEALDVLAKDEFTAVEHACNSLQQLVSQRIVLRAQIRVGNQLRL